MRVKAIGIIKDTNDKTVGAKFRDLNTGLSIYINTSTILKNKSNIHCINAVIDKNGFIRSKLHIKLNTFIFNAAEDYFMIPNNIESLIPYINLYNKSIDNRLHKLRIECIIESRDYNNNAEVLIAFNMNTLDYAIEYGNHKHVGLGTGKLLKILRESSENSVIIIHNHPTKNFISSTDLNNMIIFKSIHRIEAIVNTGDIWAVSKNNKYNKNELVYLRNYVENYDYNNGINELYLILRDKLIGLDYTFVYK